MREQALCSHLCTTASCSEGYNRFKPIYISKCAVFHREFSWHIIAKVKEPGGKLHGQHSTRHSVPPPLYFPIACPLILLVFPSFRVELRLTECLQVVSSLPLPEPHAALQPPSSPSPIFGAAQKYDTKKHRHCSPKEVWVTEEHWQPIRFNAEFCATL